MTKETIKKLSKELQNEYEIYFKENNLLYKINWSDNENGWMINIFNGDGEEFDGGLCTGSAEDAIKFML